MEPRQEAALYSRDVWLLADRLIACHGATAAIHAAERAQTLLEEKEICHVAFSALLMARHLGCRVMSMIEPGSRVLSFALAGLVTRTLLRTPILLRISVAEIVGHKGVEGLIVEGPSGPRRIDCDGIVFTAGWVPDAAGLSDGGLAKIRSNTPSRLQRTKRW